MTWGTHCCHFFQTQQDVLETLLPFFQAGLEANEFCLWVIDEPLTIQTARRALKQGIPAGDRYLRDGSMQLVSARRWYLEGGKFSMARVLRAWDKKLAQALARRYAGMRVNAIVALQKHDFQGFDEYERALNESLGRKPMIVLCSYALEESGAIEILDVARAHQCVLAKRLGKWEIVEWRPPPSSADSSATLTERERIVLALAAEGFTNPQIAEHLSISVRTVESYRASFMRKLGLRHQTDVVRYALRNGTLRYRCRGTRPSKFAPQPRGWYSRVRWLREWADSRYKRPR
jgi:DNA-binding CsgD family transcriptional regulator